jgi:hypothetical protein
MPSPNQGSLFFVGDKQVLTFVLGYNMNSYNSHMLKMTNLTSNNTFSYNNAAITVQDGPTGTMTINANLSEAGSYTAQAKSTNGANLAKHSAVFSFKVQTPSENFS